MEELIKIIFGFQFIIFQIQFIKYLTIKEKKQMPLAIVYQLIMILLCLIIYF